MTQRYPFRGFILIGLQEEGASSHYGFKVTRTSLGNLTVLTPPAARKMHVAGTSHGQCPGQESISPCGICYKKC